MPTVKKECPSCGSTEILIFFEMQDVPVHSVLLLSTREEALAYPKRDIALGFCQSCGFITNVVFDPTLHEYSADYEPTQGYSPTFNVFHQKLATDLIERYDLHGKDIIEIGCGQGEFLALLCELGDNRGIGFDPTYVSGREENKTTATATYISDFYSEKYTDHQGDFVCCKMTLEHIPDTANFVSMVRRSIGDRKETIVFFQVPSMIRILRDLAFWDIYYEHCSYFSAGSLARLFRACGFEVISLGYEYDDQYLMIAARPKNGSVGSVLPEEDDLEQLAAYVTAFGEQCRASFQMWRQKIREFTRKGKRAVIWGGASKGVAFLTMLQIRNEIEYAVDINPHKHGTYMAGTGQEIVAPEFLKEYRPDIVIVMNPIYCDEIQQDLIRMGLEAELIPV